MKTASGKAGGKNTTAEKNTEASVDGQLEKATVHLDAHSSKKEIERHKLAASRYPTIKRFLEGEISAGQAAKEIGLQRSAFYRLAKRAKNSRGYHCIVPCKTGRPQGAIGQEEKVELLIEEMIDKYFVGKAATASHVWKQCQAYADVRQIRRPGYPTVLRRIKELGDREIDLRKHGPEYVEEHYGPKPGYKKTSRALEWVQIDHTVVDIIIVDEVTRKPIGRPWISLAICIHTRVILGFYLSLLPPSAVTVAMLVENCSLPKDRLLSALDLPSDYWPMYGLAEVFHADNAKEFVSDVFELNLDDYGSKVEHRVINKKHQGGHIESLIGKMMTTKVHFLRGTTYSNVVQRKGTNSQKNATNSFEDLQYTIACEVRSYHETKHSGIGMTPAQKWEESNLENPITRLVPEEEHEYFRYLMYPEVAEKHVSNKGIQFKKRVYYSPSIDDKIQGKVLIKYDPYDLDYLLVKINEKFVKIPCVRNQWGRSKYWEVCRHQIQQKGVRNGTMTVAGGESTRRANERQLQAFNTTKAAKSAETKARKREAGEKQHKEYSKNISGGAATVQAEIDNNLHEEGNHKAKPSKPTKTKKPSYNRQPPETFAASEQKFNVKRVSLDIKSILDAELEADFTDDIILY